MTTTVPRRQALAGGLLAAAGLAAPAVAAETWQPTRTITMIVPYSAGGGADPVSRMLADGIGKRLGQSVVVEFRPGANATMGTRDVVKAKPDGYTIMLTPATPIVNMKLLMPDLGYDPQRDLTPIVEVTNSPNAVMASGQFEAKTLKEFIDYALKNPGKANVGVAALGGGGHMGAALIELVTGAKFNIVPYKGTGELLPDILGGALDGSVDFPAAYVPQAKAGNVRILGVFSDRRVPAFPNVPTTGEAGFPKLVMSGWYGIFGPRGLPRPIVDRYNAVFNEQVKDPATVQRIEALGYQMEGGTTEAFEQQIAADFDTIAKLVKADHLTLQ